MSVIQSYRAIDLEITDAHYYNGDEPTDFRNYSVHDAIPYAILDQLEEKTALNDILDLNNPNRVITEGEDTENWYNTEDWAITSSEQGGKIAIGQTISHRENKQIYGGVPLEIIQAWNFERRIKSASSMAYDSLCGIYTVSVDHQKGSVRELEQRVEKDIAEKGFAEIETIIRELDRSDPDEITNAFSVLIGD